MSDILDALQAQDDAVADQMHMEQQLAKIKPKRQSNEQHYYDILRHIARNYQTADQLRRGAEKEYGLDFEEALEYAYENIIYDAQRAIKGKRRPKE